MTHQGALLVNPSEGVHLPTLLPGAYVALLVQHPLELDLRRFGLEVRDTLMVLSPGEARACFLLRKPPDGATLARTALEHGTGGLAIDACRIRWQGESDRAAGKPGTMSREQNKIFHTPDRSHLDPSELQNPIGRWPTNLAFVHSPECCVTGTATAQAARICRYDDGLRVFAQAEGHPYTATGGGKEVVPVWACSPECPVAALDEQSADIHSAGYAMRQIEPAETHGLFHMRSGILNRYGDAGTASRYFPQFASDLDLFAWIEMLITPPGQNVYRRIE